ncbi:hypothetical protein ACF0H5_012102 [Mactra antiquata]
MDLFGRLLCLLLAVVCKIDAADILTEQEYTWPEANEMCTLATPNLTFNASGVTPDVDIPLDTDVWLGYVEIMTPFEYFGCAKKSELDHDAANFTTEGDPGKCWSACKNVTAVAVYNNECYCLHTVVNKDKNRTIKMTEAECNLGCPSQSNIVCGGKQGQGHGQTYVSLYKTTLTGPINTSNVEASFCLWYDNVTNALLWGRCTEAYPILCYKDNNVTLHDNVNSVDWKTMTTYCFQNGGIPYNYHNTMLLNTYNYTKMWTGIIRSDVINPVTDFPNNLTGKYGYVSNTKNLSFTNNQTVTKKALCVNGTISTSGTTTGIQTTTSNVTSASSSTINNTNEQEITTSQTTDNSNTTEETISTDEATTGTQHITSDVTSTSFGTSHDINETTTSSQKTDTSNQNEKTTHQQTSNTGENTSLKEESSNVGVIVGVILTIVIVIIIAIVIIVLWKRGMRIPFMHKMKPEKERKQAVNLTYHVSGLYHTNQGTFEATTSNYAEVDISKMTPENNQTQNDDSISDSSDEPHAYFILEKVKNDPNDTTKTTTMRQEEDMTNSNKLKSSESKQTQNENTNKITNSSEGTLESSTTDYAEVDVSKMSPGNKVTQNGNANRISDSSDEPHTYFVLQNNEDSPYDTTKTLHMRQEQDTYNPYNKISLEESSTYDHIGTLGVSHKDTSATDNPYNTTTLGYLRTNLGFTNSDFNRNDESEDTYNHIGDQTRQNGGIPLDNPYNTTLLGTTVLGVNNNARYNVDEIEDTYNHINGEFVSPRGKFTDNEYGTLKK